MMRHENFQERPSANAHVHISETSALQARIWRISSELEDIQVRTITNKVKKKKEKKGKEKKEKEKNKTDLNARVVLHCNPQRCRTVTIYKT
jgi:hypothetical protein